MQIVIRMSSPLSQRSMIVGPFENADIARAWAQERVERTDPLPDLLWEVDMIATPEEYDGLLSRS